MPKLASADEVVKRFTRLHEYVGDSEFARDVGRYMKLTEAQSVDNPERWISVFGAVRSNHDFQEQILAGMKKAKMYRVTPKTVDLATAAWKNAKSELTTITEYNLPVPNGWAWLDKPFVRMGVDGKEIDTQAISWDITDLSPEWAKMAATLQEFERFLKDPSSPARKPRERPAVRIMNWKWTGFVTRTWTADMRDEWLRTKGRHDLIFVHANVVPLRGLIGVPSDTITGAGNPVTWAKALWTIMETPIIRAQQVRPKGHTEKKFTEHFKGKTSNVTVIDMHAPPPQPGTGTPHSGSRNYTHQWISLGYHRHREFYIKAGNEPHEADPAERPDDFDEEQNKDTTCLTCNGPLQWIKGSIKGPEGTEIRNPEKLWQI